MSTVRKTVPRDLLVTSLNRALAHDGALTDAQRLTLASFVGGVLSDTDSYRGFAYLPSELDENGALLPDYNDSRRRYL